VRVLRAATADPDSLVRVAGRLPGYHEPALIVWASEDSVMPPEHGRGLAGLLPHEERAEVADS
jgi:pimeloyl-ACP methyl ester carboxylesterase